jgi:DNA (cytosine-5)-methyltransferase 1
MPRLPILRLPKEESRVKIGSLCSGIGGLDLAAEAHFEAETVWHCEVDPDAARVLAAHWPNTPNHGDLTAVDWSAVEPVDILTAGYPCQPFSLAGPRKGTNDVRHLWPHIADAIRLLGPRFVLLENVRGHISLGFDRVLGDLAALGFNAEWTLVSAASIGACHRRDRLFVLATANTHRVTTGRNSRSTPRTQTSRENEPVESDGHRSRSTCDDPSPNPDRLARSTGSALDRRPGTVGEPGTVAGTVGLHRSPVTDTNGHGLESNDETAQLRGGELDASGSRSPTADTNGRRWDGRTPSRESDLERINSDSAVGSEGERFDNRSDRRTTPDPGPVGWGSGIDDVLAGKPHTSWGRYALAVEQWERIIGRRAPAPTVDGRLNPALTEWMMGYPEGWITDVDLGMLGPVHKGNIRRTAALRLAGNAVVPQAALAALNILDETYRHGI